MHNKKRLPKRALDRWDSSPLSDIFLARWFPVVGAAIPYLLFTFLYIVNPRYISHFFEADVRSLGLLALGAVLLLSLMAYVLLRGCFLIIGAGRRVLGAILATGVMAALVLPATLLLALRPAALILIRAEL